MTFMKYKRMGKNGTIIFIQVKYTCETQVKLSEPEPII